MFYAYIRVSTVEQTVENQHHEIESRGYLIDKWFEDEGVSGTVDYHKRHLNGLLKELKWPAVKLLVFVRLVAFVKFELLVWRSRGKTEVNG